MFKRSQSSWQHHKKQIYPEIESFTLKLNYVVLSPTFGTDISSKMFLFSMTLVYSPLYWDCLKSYTVSSWKEWDVEEIKLNETKKNVDVEYVHCSNWECKNILSPSFYELFQLTSKCSPMFITPISPLINLMLFTYYFTIRINVTPVSLMFSLVMLWEHY